ILQSRSAHEVLFARIGGSASLLGWRTKTSSRTRTDISGRLRSNARMRSEEVPLIPYAIGTRVWVTALAIASTPTSVFSPDGSHFLGGRPRVVIPSSNGV